MHDDAIEIDTRCRGRTPKAAVALLASVTLAVAEPIPLPEVKDPALEVTLIASEPDIVTPVGCAVDAKGRLFVVESHTHFPPANYAGPKTDRIKIFEDTDGDGKPDKITVFAEDLKWTMNIAFAPDGSLYVVHRNGVIRMTEKDGKCATRTNLVTMETKGDYPHNGLSGIAFGPHDTMYLGMGENLGMTYTVRGSDGSSFSGGDGGNIFRCRRDGSKLERLAQGCWNVFGLECDASGNLFAVDNDPDSSPPCRLLHVIEGADFGYKYRFGRSGLHPFQCWNGELPGTVPMLAGTGEAPSAVLDTRRAKLPASLAGALLVTSWGDHDLEVFRPVPKGASFTAERKVIVQGDDNFRPVGLAVAKDGSVFFTDWVSASYNVHGHGRIWLLAAKKGAPIGKASHLPRAPLPTLKNLSAIRNAFGSADPFIRSAAMTELARLGNKAESEFDSPNSAIRLGALLALRRAPPSDATPILRRALADPDQQVRLVAALWVGESKLTALTDDLPKALNGPVSRRLLDVERAAAAVLAGQKDAPPSFSGEKIQVMDLASEGPPPFDNDPAPTRDPNEKGPTTDDEWRTALAAGKGDVESGQKVFFRANLKCAVCHRVEGRGGTLGPDLSVIAHGNDREKLMQSLLHPSRDIAPQFVGHTVKVIDGETYNGRLFAPASDGSVTLYTADEKAVYLPKNKIASDQLSSVSLMPENLIEGMSVADFRDLLAYLLNRK